MGEPMCRNRAQKSGARVIAFDLRLDPLRRLSLDAVAAATSPAAVAQAADVVFLSLPGDAEIRKVAGELLESCREGQVFVDCSTAPVALARELAAAFSARGAHFADAPV